MPYRVEIPSRVRRQMPQWPMPDMLLVDCYERLANLRENPAQQLTRLEQPFTGMGLVFDVVDPTNRLAVHHFTFRIVYSMDEQTLFVDAALHERHTVGQ